MADNTLTMRVSLDSEVSRLIDAVTDLTRENRALRNRLVSEIAQHVAGDYETRVAEAEARVNEFEDAFRSAMRRRAPNDGL